MSIERTFLLKLSLAVVLLLVFLALAAIHWHNQRRQPVPPLERDASALSHATRTLVVYFTRSGRTRSVAETIAAETGADILEIRVETPYPEAYHATVLQAHREIRDHYRPPLVLPLESLDKYDTLFIGTPNWWSTLAPPVASFLTRFRLAGKTVIPFVTHGGGGLADCERDLQALCPGAAFRPALALKDADVPNAAQTVRDWARRSLAPAP
ncbi:MAG: flavodoxin [Oligosphaeraceae bacterium]